jgi:hypothetical protein
MAQKMTPKQFEALCVVYRRWQHTTKHAILPQDGVEIVSEEDYGTGYLGIWVGAPHNGNPGGIYLGIEADGYTHS